MTLEEVEIAWSSVCDLIGAGQSLKPNGAGPSTDPLLNRKAADAGLHDHRFEWLSENVADHGVGRRGQLFIDCPFKGDHSMDSGPTQTAYFPASTGGYARGHYKCMHASCGNYEDGDFDAALGYPGDELDHAALLERESVGCVDISNPIAVAREIAAVEFTVTGEATLTRYNGSWYRHDGTRYVEILDELIRSTIWRLLERSTTHDKSGVTVPVRPTVSMVNGVVEALKAVVRTPEADAPTWLEPMDVEADNVIPLRNGLFDSSRRKLLPHTANFFALNCLPFSFEESPTASKVWIRFLSEIWPDDPQAIRTLQEMFGYLLTSDTSQQKIFLLCGPPRSGKGTIGRVLRALLGAYNVAGPPLSSLTSHFGLQPLIGKLVALVPDARIDGKQHSHAIVEKLLMLSGEDVITIDRKNKDAWTGQCKARIVMLANEPPRLADTSGAIASRFVTLQIRKSFLGNEDTGLTTKLLLELPGIFAWALEGRERLRKRGYFEQPQSGDDLAQQIADLGSPIKIFVRDCCTLDPFSTESVGNVYQAYRSWCFENGHHPAAVGRFSSSLTTAFPQLDRHQPRSIEDGKQHRSIVGIRLQRDDQNWFDDTDDTDDTDM